MTAELLLGLVPAAVSSPAFVVLVAASLLVAYFLVGYPLLLAYVSRRPGIPVRKDPAFRPSVSILLAVHNGAAFVTRKLECLLALGYPPHLLQILVASDGSTDGTDRLVEEFVSRGVRLVRVPRGGKAAALNALLPHATGEILFFTDVRQILAPDALAHLAANFADPAVGAVTGELRMLKHGGAIPSGSPGEQADMELYWRYELWARRCHSTIDSIFSVTGCIYALRRSLALPLPAGTLTDDAVFSLRAFFRGYRVIFDPAAVAYDYPTAEGGEFRRKLRTLAGLWQLHLRFPALFTSADRMRWHFLSYKFGRLVLPWAILAVWGATLALPAGSFRDFLLLDELVFVALALIDRLVPRRWPIKRISSPAKTFLAMNLAALLSPIVFLVPAESLWKKPTQVVASARSTSGSGPGR
jgi:biofilm PGA synthesis N-glycosyltransferase PgaC